MKLAKIRLLLLAVIGIDLLISSGIVFGIGFFSLLTTLQVKMDAVQRDISYHDGTWDIRRYASDPVLLGTDPLYVIASDGYVVDRRGPIHGFLDTSNFSLLLSYRSPRFVTTVAGQTRRMYSLPIVAEKKTVGVISVAYFNPPASEVATIDAKLTTVANRLLRHISVRNGVIETNEIDERFVPYDVTFAIVDTYNSVLKKTTNTSMIKRIASVIDPSYVKAQLAAPSSLVVRDTQTGAIYFLLKRVLVHSSQPPHGIALVGASLNPLFFLTGTFLWLKLLGDGILVLVGFFLYRKGYTNTMVAERQKAFLEASFDERNGKLFINESAIAILYASNQYYLLSALFSNPSKRFEAGVLLERLGEEITESNTRKIYDAMRKINKKVEAIVPLKLIINQNKTFRLNPEFICHKKSH